VVFRASDGFESAGFDKEYDYETPFEIKSKHGQEKEEALDELLEMALNQNSFSGWHLEYNDQAHNRMSGYDRQAETIHVEIEDVPSGHESMEARLQLQEWLAANEWDNDDINDLMKLIADEV
jgi:hypothetical protein